MNKNTVQRIFQLKGWQVRKRPIGQRPRIQALPSVATQPDERWSTDLCRVWGGTDGWLSLALVIDCHTRELLGWLAKRATPTHDHRTTSMPFCGRTFAMDFRCPLALPAAARCRRCRRSAPLCSAPSPVWLSRWPCPPSPDSTDLSSRTSRSAAAAALALRGLASHPAHGIFLITQVEELYVPKRSPPLAAAHFGWHGE